jgi:GTP pyrophosphokinase
MSIGSNIKSLREERKFTQEQVADALNVTFQAVSSWERDEYIPDVNNLINLAKFFDVSISSIVEDKNRTFKTKQALYDWEHMRTYVKATAKYCGLENTSKAIDFAIDAHQGQTRKRSNIPYIYHPFTLVCHFLAMNIIEDEILAACMLHDVVEDCGKKLEDLPVDDKTKELVRLITCEKTNKENRERILNAYYGEIYTNAQASIIKCVDRCNNLTTMSWGLSREKIYRMIKETEIYYPKLIEVVKAVPKYNNAAWLLEYQIESTLDIYKRLM